MWSPSGLIPWFSKEGNTYATLLHHPFLFKGKPTQCSRGSIPFVIGMLLARDSIVGILIPSSISLPASLFTHSVLHHPTTNSLVTLFARLCYLLSMRWFSLEEERVMQQSSICISLSFWEPRYQSSRILHTSHLVPAQRIKNLATKAIKGLSIPSRSLTRVRSDRDNIFGVFGIKMQSKK